MICVIHVSHAQYHIEFDPKGIYSSSLGVILLSMSLVECLLNNDGSFPREVLMHLYH